MSHLLACLLAVLEGKRTPAGSTLTRSVPFPLPLVSFLFVLIGLAVLMKWAANADAFELKYEDMFTTVLPGLPLLLFLVWMGYAYQWKSSWIE